MASDDINEWCKSLNLKDGTGSGDIWNSLTPSEKTTAAGSCTCILAASTFANTIGYTVIKTMGVTDILRKMIKTTKDKGNEETGKPIVGKQPPKSSGQQGGQRGGQGKADKAPPALPPIPPSPAVVAAKAVAKEKAKESRVEMKEILKYVQNDPSLIINEITPGNWDEWMEETALPKLFKKQYSLNKNHEDIAKLYNLVSLRDLVGEFIWLISAVQSLLLSRVSL